MDAQPTAGDLLLEVGEKIHVAARRGFEGDARRHFVGVISRSSVNAVRAVGYAFIFDLFTGQFAKRPELRTRIIPLVDANLIIKVIPTDVEIARVRYKLSDERRLVLSDDVDFVMDVEEYNYKQR